MEALESAQEIAVKKYGPLPVWGWGAGAGAVVVAILWMRGRGATSGGVAPVEQTVTGGVPPVSAPSGGVGSTGEIAAPVDNGADFRATLLSFGETLGKAISGIPGAVVAAMPAGGTDATAPGAGTFTRLPGTVAGFPATLPDGPFTRVPATVPEGAEQAGGAGSPAALYVSNVIPDRRDLAAIPLGSRVIVTSLGETTGPPAVFTNRGTSQGALSRLSDAEFAKVPDFVRRDTG